MNRARADRGIEGEEQTMKRTTTAACLAFALAGCAHTPPNSPGMGYGRNYTPVVDTVGLDMQRYTADLEGCRSLASQIDPNKMAMDRMFAGIIAGAVLGAAAGGNRYWTEQGALAGGSAGVAAGGARGVMKQETVMANCMAGRGYRVLDASVPTNPNVASPYAANQPAMMVVPASAQSPATPADVGTSLATPGCAWEGYQWKCRTN
jgi:outer membrane lipoprotein SlyB